MDLNHTTNAPLMEAEIQEVPSEQTAAPEQTAVPPRRLAGKRDLLLAGLLLLFCTLFWDCMLWAGRPGLGHVLSLLALGAAALFYLRRKGKQTLYGTLCAVLFAVGVVSLFVSADNRLTLLSFPLLTALFLVSVMERMGLRSGEGLFDRIRDFFRAAFPLRFGRIKPGVRALVGGAFSNSGSRKRVGAVFLGLLFAVPVLMILLPLLISSDAAFAGLFRQLNWGSLRRAILTFHFGLGGMLLLFGFLFFADEAAPQRSGSRFRGVEPASVIAFLGAISLAYVLYLVSQLAYFFDGFRGLLPEDFTVAQYARRGFFEMCAVVTITLTLIVLAAKLCRKAEGGLPGVVKGLCLFLCLFSLLLVGTALSKMLLYVRSFGLTRLRVLTSAFMLYLAAVLITVGLRLFLRRVPAVQIAFAAAAAVLITLNLMNVDGLIARYNIRGYQTHKLDSLDMDTICGLNDGAVPYILELTEDPDPEIAGRARAELLSRLDRLDLVQNPTTGKVRSRPTDLRSLNLTRQAAKNALLEKWGDGK